MDTAAQLKRAMATMRAQEDLIALGASVKLGANGGSYDTGMVHGPADVTVDDYARFSYYAVRASDLRMSNARDLARAVDIIQRRLIAPR